MAESKAREVITLPVGNEKFAKYAANLANIGQDTINYWCNITTVMSNNKVNENFYNQRVMITYDEHIILEGVIQKISVDTIENTYNNFGNHMLGLPDNYKLEDFVYEINDTFDLKHQYVGDDDIASIIIRVTKVNKRVRW